MQVDASLTFNLVLTRNLAKLKRFATILSLFKTPSTNCTTLFCLSGILTRHINRTNPNKKSIELNRTPIVRLSSIGFTIGQTVCCEYDFRTKSNITIEQIGCSILFGMYRSWYIGRCRRAKMNEQTEALF